MNKLYPFFLLLISLTAFDVKAQQAPATSLQDIRQQCRRLLLSDTAYATEQSFRLTDDVKYNTDANGYFKSLGADGTWKDLDYSNDSPSAWQPIWHLYRLMLMCRQWNRTQDPQQLAAIHRALAYYIRNDFKCSNWWQNQINVPYAYSSILLMLDKEINAAELAYLNNVQVGREQMQKTPTGQNKIWQKDIEARIALLHNDEAAFTIAISSMESVITRSTDEGIQPDNSFQQHGAMLQFGNYGLHFANSLLFWIKLTANTSFAFDKDKQQIVFDYCANGLRWTVFKGAMDITAVGRQLRPNFTSKRGVNLHDDFGLIRSFDNNPCNYFLDGMDPALTCTMVGNRAFWRSDYMVQLSTGQYMMSVKTHGPFVKRVESINGENLSGAFLNDGVTLIQKSGNEYKNISPLWRWNMLPGTTTDTTLNVNDAKVLASKNEAGFVGEISDGNIGASAMLYDRLGVNAHKSYFFINDMMVALGAGITAPNKANVVTTVNQRYYNFKTGKHLKGENWVWHEGIGYFFPDRSTELKTSIQKRKADWGSVDKTSKGIMATDSVITWYIGHNNSDKYQYMIKPNFGVVDTRKLAYHLPVKVIANSVATQAVQSGNTIIAVFYKPGVIYLSESQRIQTDQPCMLICKTGSNGSTEVWASDPSRKLQTLNITITKRTIPVQLPQGDMLGSSVKIAL